VNQESTNWSLHVHDEMRVRERATIAKGPKLSFSDAVTISGVAISWLLTVLFGLTDICRR